MTKELLPAVEVEPAGKPNGSIVWLHGLGADGHDFEPIVPALGLDGVRFVFPHAPPRPVTINGGMVMRAWYDIKSLDIERNTDVDELDQSRSQLEAWLAHERELGIPSDRIVAAGFSQGGAIALYTGLALEERIGGILALSCYHPRIEAIPSAEGDLPIFMAHGTHDPIVPIGLAEATLARLRERGFTPEWHTYPMPHSLSPPEIDDIGRWLRQRFA
ncbi:MAG TPA: dienelactone hydrolase family protein [Vicinamibacteria bacterium]|nr:dienelactone hydrolase family protein [Vicinamibacteria bacterium]